MSLISENAAQPHRSFYSGFKISAFSTNAHATLTIMQERQDFTGPGKTLDAY
jgi:hypothetical protein